MNKIFIQILKNQNHILWILDCMGQSGNVNTGHFSKDKISEELREKTYKLLKTLEK